MFHIENTRWPFYWAVWEVPLLPATARAKPPGVEPGCLLLPPPRPVDTVPRRSLCCPRTLMRFGSECRDILGHLPFCASVAPTAWTFCWPGARRVPWTAGSSTDLSAERGGDCVREEVPHLLTRDHVCVCVSDEIMPIHRGRSKLGRQAWRKLHYQEYLGERISVNPNRYRDLFLLVMDLLKNFASSVLAFCFWFSFLKPHCLFFFVFPSFLIILSVPPPSPESENRPRRGK